MMDHLLEVIKSSSGLSFTDSGKTFTVAKADNFSYKDPVDGSLAENQVEY